jgi:hypothetical protein
LSTAFEEKLFIGREPFYPLHRRMSARASGASRVCGLAALAEFNGRRGPCGRKSTQSGWRAAKSCQKQINQREGLASTVVTAAAEAFDERQTGLGIAAHGYEEILPRNRPAGKEVFADGGYAGDAKRAPVTSVESSRVRSGAPTFWRRLKDCSFIPEAQSASTLYLFGRMLTWP